MKIFMFDHNKDHVNTWAGALLNLTTESSQYIQGTAYHWYAGGMVRFTFAMLLIALAVPQKLVLTCCDKPYLVLVSSLGSIVRWCSGNSQSS